MIYDYRCINGHVTELHRPVAQADQQHICHCGQDAFRVFSPTLNINPGQAAFKPGRYHAFGKDFETRRQVNEEIRRIKGETGKEIIELGNEKLNVKPQRKQVDMAEATRELRHKLRGRVRTA